MGSPFQGIDGKYLVIADKTALPQRCVRTNLPVTDREYSAWNLPLIPSWSIAVMIVVPFFLIAMPYAARHRCRFKAGLSRGVRLRYAILKVIAGMLIIGSFVVPFVAVALESETGLMSSVILFPILFWGGFAMLILFSSPFIIMKHKDGGYWIRGCSKAFLDSLKDTLRENIQA